MAIIIDRTILVFTLLIIGRSVLSFWPNLDYRNPVVEFLMTVTEPILAPIRAVVPRFGMFDISPMLAILLLNLLVKPLLINALA